MDEFSRSRILLGESTMLHLQQSKVILFGVGGVGGYIAEALIRGGIGSITLVDHDRVSITNINRQIIALHSTIGKLKTEVLKERLNDINPAAEIIIKDMFYLPENANEIDFTQYDYVIDAVDTVTAKLEIIVRAKKANVPVISAMGAGNKIDASCFEITDIYNTKTCPLAKVMRRELRKRNVDHLKIIFSTEPSLEIKEDNLARENEEAGKKRVIGSVSYIPGIAGLMLAGEVIKDLISS